MTDFIMEKKKIRLHKYLLLVPAHCFTKWTQLCVGLCVGRCVWKGWGEAFVYTFNVLSGVWVPRLFFQSVCVCVCVRARQRVRESERYPRECSTHSVYEMNNASGDSFPFALLSFPILISVTRLNPQSFNHALVFLIFTYSYMTHVLVSHPLPSIYIIAFSHSPVLSSLCQSAPPKTTHA